MGCLLCLIIGCLIISLGDLLVTVKFREPLILHLIKLNNLVYYKKVQIMLKVKSNTKCLSVQESRYKISFFTLGKP